jgi:hypothetical protein
MERPVVTVDAYGVHVAVDEATRTVPLEDVEGIRLNSAAGWLVAVHLPEGTLAAADVGRRWRDLVPRDDVVICDPSQIVGADRLGVDLDETMPATGSLSATLPPGGIRSVRHLFSARPGEVSGWAPWSMWVFAAALSAGATAIAVSDRLWGFLVVPALSALTLWVCRWRITDTGAEPSRLRAAKLPGRLSVPWSRGRQVRVSRGRLEVQAMIFGRSIGGGGLRKTRVIAVLCAAQQAGVLPDDLEVRFEVKVAGRRHERRLNEAGVRWYESRWRLFGGPVEAGRSPLLDA